MKQYKMVVYNKEHETKCEITGTPKELNRVLPGIEVVLVNNEPLHLGIKMPNGSNVTVNVVIDDTYENTYPEQNSSFRKGR